MTLFDLIKKRLIGQKVRGLEVVDVIGWSVDVDQSLNGFPDESYLDVVMKVPDARCRKGWRRKAVNISMDEVIDGKS